VARREARDSSCTTRACLGASYTIPRRGRLSRGAAWRGAENYRIARRGIFVLDHFTSVVHEV